MDRGRGQKRFMDVVRIGVTQEDAGDRVRWRKVIHCGDP